MTLLYFVAGLALLIGGAEALVRGASRLAATARISPLVIGLTVVAFGTSAPELAVSVKSAMSGDGALAIGNVVGSNIFNILFILGISALIMPLAVSRQLLRLDVPLMILISILVYILGWNGKLNRIEGLILTIGLMLYTFFLIRLSRKEKPAVHNEYEGKFGRKTASGLKYALSSAALVVCGLGVLLLGADIFIKSAVSIARHLGVSELVIGLTIVAAGTSLPEVVTSITAGIKGQRDIAVGNVIGSNLFNLMGVLGVASIFAPDGIAVTRTMLAFDLPVMMAVAVACLPIFFTGNLIARWEGALFLIYYLLFSLHVILTALNSISLSLFNAAMLYYVLPLTGLTLLTISARELKKHMGRKEQ